MTGRRADWVAGGGRRLSCSRGESPDTTRVDPNNGPPPNPEGTCKVPDTITITDDRTGKTITVPISDGVFPSSALRELDPDLRMYDPAYLSTAACRSSITYLDGDNGVLRYRGYPIEQLAEKST